MAVIIIVADFAEMQNTDSKQDPNGDWGNDLEDVDENDKHIPL